MCGEVASRERICSHVCMVGLPLNLLLVMMEVLCSNSHLFTTGTAGQLPRWGWAGSTGVNYQGVCIGSNEWLFVVNGMLS